MLLLFPLVVMAPARRELFDDLCRGAAGTVLEVLHGAERGLHGGHSVEPMTQSLTTRM